MSNSHDRILAVLGKKDRVMDNVFTSTEDKISSVLDLKDNPAVQVAGMFAQQQPSAALPQLSEALTQLALQGAQEEINKSTAVNDPMEAENDRLRRQKNNLQLQKEIGELQAEMQAPPPPAGAGAEMGAPAGGMPGGEAQMPPEMAGAYGAAPALPAPAPAPAPGAGADENANDPMAALRSAVGA